MRPFVDRELGNARAVAIINQGRGIRIRDGQFHDLEVEYDHVFDEHSTQEDIFSAVSGVVTHFLNGFNCTIFTYGQTGSGKTYTMFGNGLGFSDAKNFANLETIKARQHDPVKIDRNSYIQLH